MRAFEVFDLTLALGTETSDYPGDPPLVRELFATHGAHGYEASRLSMSAHAGTHLDAPAHFCPGGLTIDRLGPADLILPALVLESFAEGGLDAAELEPARLAPGLAVLVKTENSRSGLVAAGSFAPHHPALTLPSAAALVAAGVKLVGVDGRSADPIDSADFPIHRLLLGAGVPILENLNLAAVPPGPYLLVCAPLKIRAEGAPARAFLFREKA